MIGLMRRYRLSSRGRATTWYVAVPAIALTVFSIGMSNPSQVGITGSRSPRDASHKLRTPLRIKNVSV